MGVIGTVLTLPLVAVPGPHRTFFLAAIAQLAG